MGSHQSRHQATVVTVFAREITIRCRDGTSRYINFNTEYKNKPLSDSFDDLSDLFTIGTTVTYLVKDGVQTSQIKFYLSHVEIVKLDTTSVPVIKNAYQMDLDNKNIQYLTDEGDVHDATDSNAYVNSIQIDSIRIGYLLQLKVLEVSSPYQCKGVYSVRCCSSEMDEIEETGTVERICRIGNGGISFVEVTTIRGTVGIPKMTDDTDGIPMGHRLQMTIVPNFPDSHYKFGAVGPIYDLNYKVDTPPKSLLTEISNSQPISRTPTPSTSKPKSDPVKYATETATTSTTAILAPQKMNTIPSISEQTVKDLITSLSSLLIIGPRCSESVGLFETRVRKSHEALTYFLQSKSGFGEFLDSRSDVFVLSHKGTMGVVALKQATFYIKRADIELTELVIKLLQREPSVSLERILYRYDELSPNTQRMINCSKKAITKFVQRNCNTFEIVRYKGASSVKKIKPPDIELTELLNGLLQREPSVSFDRILGCYDELSPNTQRMINCSKRAIIKFVERNCNTFQIVRNNGASSVKKRTTINTIETKSVLVQTEICNEVLVSDDVISIQKTTESDDVINDDLVTAINSLTVKDLTFENQLNFCLESFIDLLLSDLGFHTLMVKMYPGIIDDVVAIRNRRKLNEEVTL